MGAELLGVVFGLASAASWGVGDFCGGVAAKRSHVYGVVIVSQVVGLALLVSLALLLAEPFPPGVDLLLGGAAGLAGGLGLAALYRGLAVGRMGVVAPVNAVVSAGIPVAFGAFAEGLASTQQIVGFGLALVAVWLVSRASDGTGGRLRDLGLPILAGLGFGIFLIVIDGVSEAGILWPLAAARTASIALLLVAVALQRSRSAILFQHLPLIALAGLFDSGGNTFYALAARAGRLDVAAILSSLHPAVIVLLARLLLKERLAQLQWIGVVLALVAVILIAS